MENRTYPPLDLDEQSFEIVKAFIPEFYEYLRLKPQAVSSLMALHRGGNDKAGEIITYLVGTPNSPLALIEGSHSKEIFEKKWPGPATYTLTWSAFRVEDSDKGNMRIEFDIEALFKKETEVYDARLYLIDAGDGIAFRKDFLLKEVSEWLKEKRFKLRRSDPIKNIGLLKPYVKIELTPINPIPNKEYPEREPEIWGSAKEFTGKCSIQILTID
jgi:hypothetical protein